MDSKNVESFYCSQCNLAEAAHASIAKKKKFKLEKLLKPLLKKINGDNRSREPQSIHPNNVNLNNTKNSTADNVDGLKKSCNETKNQALNATYVKDKKTIDGPRSKRYIEYFQSKYSQENFTSFEDFQKYGKEIYIPVKYIRTDDETFFWTQTLKKVDDNLIVAAVSNSNNQSVEKDKCNNKTILSLI